MEYQNGNNLKQYIRITLLYSPRAKELLNYMSSCLKTLKKFENEITSNCNFVKKSIDNAINLYPYQFDRSKFSNKVCFIINKYFNLFLKYQTLRFIQLNQAKQIVVEFKDLIISYSKQNIPIQIQFDEFLSSTLKKSNPEITRTEFKLISLFHYLNNIPNVNINRFQIISNKELFEQLKKLSPEVDTINDYIYQNIFDTMFESYVESNKKLLNIFNQIIGYDGSKNNDIDKNYTCKINNHNNINEMIETKQICNNFGFVIDILNNKKYKNSNNNEYNLDSIIKGNYTNTKDKNEFDFKYFEFLVQKVYIQITESNKIDERQFIVLRCAALRFLCNKYYIIHNKEWIENTNDVYIKNYIKIINQTPRDLKISSEIIPLSFYDSKFKTILLGENFKKAIKHMFSIQLLTCPIDIWNEMQNSIDYSMKGANNLSNSNTFAQNISFDDYFSIILPVFASAEITSPNALYSFLTYFMSIPRSNGIDITAVSTAALSCFVRNELN